MARIAGVTLPNDKRIEIGLTYVKGIGLKTSQELLTTCSIDRNIRVKDLSDDQVRLIADAIEKTGKKIEGDLVRDVLAHVKRLKEIGSYRGNRHTRHLPARGQRTKTNNRTVRGNVRKTAGSGRKVASQKT